MSLAKRQRAALCELLLDVGPFAPTNCEGWQAQDLAAHLWIRENQPSALPGIGSERFAERTERLQIEALHRHGFLGLVQRLQRPGWVMRPVDRWVNAAEWTIHHMDVLKPQRSSLVLDRDDEKRLWKMASLLSRRTKFDGRLVLESPYGRTERGSGASTVHLIGNPTELLYFFSGRVADADLTVVGEPGAVESLKESVAGL